MSQDIVSYNYQIIDLLKLKVHSFTRIMSTAFI